jgi:hypothetical protein
VSRSQLDDATRRQDDTDQDRERLVRPEEGQDGAAADAHGQRREPDDKVGGQRRPFPNAGHDHHQRQRQERLQRVECNARGHAGRDEEGWPQEPAIRW